MNSKLQLFSVQLKPSMNPHVILWKQVHRVFLKSLSSLLSCLHLDGRWPTQCLFFLVPRSSLVIKAVKSPGGCSAARRATLTHDNLKRVFIIWLGLMNNRIGYVFLCWEHQQADTEINSKITVYKATLWMWEDVSTTTDDIWNNEMIERYSGVTQILTYY